MSGIDDALRQGLFGLVPELVARVREELGQPRMLPIKGTVVSYRQILDGERRGEIAVYRVGHSSFVAEDELFAWIRRTGATKQEPAEPIEASDEIAEVIDANRRRVEARGKGRAA